MSDSDHRPPDDEARERAARDEPDPTTPGTGDEEPGGEERRLWHSLFRPTRNQLVVALLLALLGYAAVTQVRITEVEDSYAGLREQDLIDVLSGLTGTSQRAQNEIERLEERRNELRSGTQARQAALEEARQEADSLSVLAGLVPVTGPGVRITITPGEGVPDADLFIDLLQYLRNAGAEAVQINGVVRVVAQSYFDQTANGLVVDGAELTGPYVIDAIGDPFALREGVTFVNGPQSQFADAGAELEIEEHNTLDISAVRESPDVEYAQPDSGR